MSTSEVCRKIMENWQGDSHTQLRHTQFFHHTVSSRKTLADLQAQLFQKRLCRTQSAMALCVTSVALVDIDAPLASQAWHLLTSTLLLRGKRGPCGTGFVLVARLVRATVFCVANVAHMAPAWLLWRVWSRLAPRSFA